MNDTLAILEKVNAFYSGAFSQLVTFTIGLLALVGVLIPIAIAAYQNRQLKHDQRSLSDKISHDLASAKRELSEQLEKDVTTRDDELRLLIASVKSEVAKEIQKTHELAIAGTLHLQALSNYEKEPQLAAVDCLDAISSYAAGGDERNLQAVITIFTKCIEKVTSETFKLYDFDEHARTATDALTALAANGRYTENIRSIRTGVEEARTRKSP